MTTTAHRLAAPPDPAPAAYLDCHGCELFGTAPWPPAAAEHLAAIHDDIHHQGRPTAHARPA